jgi:hypothetical protein
MSPTDQHRHIDSNWAARECGWFDRLVLFFFTRTVNLTIKSILSAAFERGTINSEQFHALVGIADRRLYPFPSTSRKVVQTGNVVYGDIAGGDINK